MKSFLILEYLPKFLYYTKTDVLWDKTLDLNILFAGGINLNLAYNSAMPYSISL
jgi:hypothetical protein